MAKPKPKQAPIIMEFTAALHQEIRRIVREELAAEQKRNRGEGFLTKIKTKGI